FLDRLSVALDRARRSGASVAVLFLDVDNFKDINDSRGHSAGDHLLVELAERLRTMLRPMDTVARFGGDEFTFLFEDLADEREVVAIAQRISDSAGLPFRLDGAQVTVTASIGIAIVADAAIPPEAVIQEADAAMYRAKEHGRARFELFDEASGQRAMERLELESDLRQALDRRELLVHYQPQVSLRDRFAFTGLEALVCWHHPEPAITVLQGLGRMGVRLAIDDFGTGSSSLQALKRLPIDTIKIHESVLASSSEERPVLGAVVGIGHALGLRVIAEGVETEE